MADDIVTQLQNAVFRDFGDGTVLGGSLYEEAADEIQRLRAVITGLRAEVQRLQQVNRG